MSYLNHSLVLLFLLVGSAFFSVSETALFSLSHVERRRIQSRYPVRGRFVEGLLTNPRRTLVAILIGNNVINIFAGTVATTIALHLFGDRGVGVAIGSINFLMDCRSESINASVRITPWI